MQAPSASRQLAFHQLLVAARNTWLRDALSAALQEVDQAALKYEYRKSVPGTTQRALASAGIRDEFVFPSVTLLTADPRLLGYYRLLLGTSQKTFYSSETGFTRFKAMEVRGLLSDRNAA